MDIAKVNKSDDFEAIGNIYAQSWKAAYREIVPQDYLDGLSGRKWSSVLENSEFDAFVVKNGDQYIGTSSICAARDAAKNGWGEIISIYLLPEYFGKGYAKPLLDHVINALKNAGYKDIYLWVLNENFHAQKFYKKHGFQPNGDTNTITIGGQELTEIRYVKHL